MQLTPRGKRVIDLAYDEARQLNHDYIASQHLLLGVIREGDSVAGLTLASLGVELGRARQLAAEHPETAWTAAGPDAISPWESAVAEGEPAARVAGLRWRSQDAARARAAAASGSGSPSGGGLTGSSLRWARRAGKG